MVPRVADDGNRLALADSVSRGDEGPAVVHVDGNAIAIVLHHHGVASAGGESREEDSAFPDGFDRCVFWSDEVHAPMSDAGVPLRGDGAFNRRHPEAGFAKGIGTVDCESVFFLDPFAQTVQRGGRGGVELIGIVRIGTGQVWGDGEGAGRKVAGQDGPQVVEVAGLAVQDGGQGVGSPPGVRLHGPGLGRDISWHHPLLEWGQGHQGVGDEGDDQDGQRGEEPKLVGLDAHGRGLREGALLLKDELEPFGRRGFGWGDLGHPLSGWLPKDGRQRKDAP